MSNLNSRSSSGSVGRSRQAAGSVKFLFVMFSILCVSRLKRTIISIAFDNWQRHCGFRLIYLASRTAATHPPRQVQVTGRSAAALAQAAPGDRAGPIGHTKSDNRMDRCWLSGSTGDALHAVLCAAGFNIRWLLRRSPPRGWRPFSWPSRGCRAMQHASATGCELLQLL
jgi:hypothetical protein